MGLECLCVCRGTVRGTSCRELRRVWWDPSALDSRLVVVVSTEPLWWLFWTTDPPVWYATEATRNLLIRASSGAPLYLAAVAEHRPHLKHAIEAAVIKVVHAFCEEEDMLQLFGTRFSRMFKKPVNIQRSLMILAPLETQCAVYGTYISRYISSRQLPRTL